MRALILGLISASVAFGAETPRPLMRDFIGLNAQATTIQAELYAPVTRLARDFHALEWDLGSDPATPTAFPFGKNNLDWAQVYGAWRKAGIDIHASLLFETIAPNAWTEPETNGLAYGRAFAQAFGPSAQMPLVSSVEIGNEPGEFSAETYRTLFLAFSRGLRQGDPKLKISTCNVTAGPSTRFARSIEEFRGLERAFDVLSVHAYAEVEGWPTWRRSFPEDPGIHFLKDIRDICVWRDRNAPGKAVWLTEFGWDASTRTPDPNGPVSRWIGVTDQQQAQWLVRSLLLFASMPIERAYIYTANDDDLPNVHAASGLTRHLQPKPSFHALAHLQKTLGDYRFSGVVRQDAGLILLRFRHATDAKKMIMVGWSPTGDDRVIKVKLPVQPGTKITRVQYMPITPLAEEEPIPAIVDGQVDVTIRETPIFGWVQAP